MKALIWIGNFLAITFLNAILVMLTGFRLGYILAFVAYFVLPRFWFQMYDEHMLNKHMNDIKPEATALGMSTVEYLLKDVPQNVIDMCEHYIGNTAELKEFLNTCKNDKQISKYVYLYLLRRYK